MELLNNILDQIQVFIIDDEEDVRDSLSQTLSFEGIKSEGFGNPAEAIYKCKKGWPGVVICDLSMPDMDGLEVLDQILEIDNEIPVILFSAHADISIALKAVRQGAYDFLEKTEDPQTQVDTIHRAITKRALVLENIELRKTLDNAHDIESRLIGHGQAINTVKKELINLAQVDVDVILNGETGTGKEVVARCIHDFSARKAEPFVAINCGAISENLIESELFGHEVGSFTGASKKRIGKLEYANGGTVFLDEVESMPHYLQIRLLRVLQERYIERVGANKNIELDIRVIAASKVDLIEHVVNGGFRQDLYYRLSIASIDLPNISQRKDDIGLLFSHFVAKASKKHHKSPASIPSTLIRQLENRDWPGNVREISNEAEKWVLGLSISQKTRSALEDNSCHSLDEKLGRFEKEVIEDALLRNDHNISVTAEDLSMPRKKLYLRMKRYSIGKYGE